MILLILRSHTEYINFLESSPVQSISTDTVIFKNHPSATLHSDAIDNYLTDELNAGRMSGPFSRQHVEEILHGPILSSPLLVAVQIQQPGTPDKL